MKTDVHLHDGLCANNSASGSADGRKGPALCHTYLPAKGGQVRGARVCKRAGGQTSLKTQHMGSHGRCTMGRARETVPKGTHDVTDALSEVTCGERGKEASMGREPPPNTGRRNIPPTSTMCAWRRVQQGWVRGAQTRGGTRTEPTRAPVCAPPSIKMASRATSSRASNENSSALASMLEGNKSCQHVVEATAKAVRGGW
jgi:hypothetical protein